MKYLVIAFLKVKVYYFFLALFLIPSIRPVCLWGWLWQEKRFINPLFSSLQFLFYVSRVYYFYRYRCNSNFNEFTFSKLCSLISAESAELQCSYQRRQFQVDSNRFKRWDTVLNQSLIVRSVTVGSCLDLSANKIN